MSKIKNGILYIEGMPQRSDARGSRPIWRVVVQDDNILFQRYEGRDWVTKHTITG